MRHTLMSVACLAALSAPASAFDTAECGEIESQIYTILDAEFGWEVTQSPTSTAQARPGACSVTDLEIYVQELGVRYTARTASLVAPQAMDWVRGDVVLPDNVTLEILDVAIDTEFGVPAGLEWIVPISAQSIFLGAGWNEATQELSVNTFRIDLGDGNSVTLALEGQADGWQPYVLRDEDFGLTQLGLDIAFNGLFELAIAPPIEANGTALTPESAQFMSAMAFGLLANVPTTLVPTASQEAIVDFIATIPNPRGDLSLSLTNDAPFSPAEIAADVADGQSLLEAVPDRLTLTADWSPAN